ncbi:ribonuclease M5 [Metabacillus iocasae]|uniref:Ribonuclease M5 n=1 Tax=Priestia iocasae TaxID=2291674 RepID=A0ABS2QZL8_9BACI|nr:ribonuclease M5 [Metabacillus iocasae]MBM7704924.1 ribonuclease M5 [Metabacillus iocasae]
MKIKEIIVVEGKDDTVVIQRAVHADTIETNGSAVSEETIEKVRLAQEKRGVIIFTDPDYPGQRIRNIITERVPGCKHAFLSKEEARPKHGKGIGVEHASLEAIREALKAVQQEWIDVKEEVSKQDLLDAGLIGGPQAKERREKLGMMLKIGYANGKQLHKRMTMFQIPRATFIEVMERINEEEKNNW